jgi:hypothetical protein
LILKTKGDELAIQKAGMSILDISQVSLVGDRKQQEQGLPQTGLKKESRKNIPKIQISCLSQ